MITSKARRNYLALRRSPAVRGIARGMGCALGGFCLSAVELAGAAQPMAMGLVCSLTGWRSVLAALGSGLGYRYFWGWAGMQGVAWTVGGCLLALMLGRRRDVREDPAVLAAAACFWAAAVGLTFRMLLGDETGLGVYLMRVTLAGGGTALYILARRERAAGEMAAATLVLALSGVVPLSIAAAGMLTASGSLSGAALAGMALELGKKLSGGVTGRLCMGAMLIRLRPESRWLRMVSPALAWAGVGLLTGQWEPEVLPWLLLGGVLGGCLPDRELRPGDGARLRLEQAAGVLDQTRQLLMEAPEVPIDEEAILARTRERACGSCPLRKTCQDCHKLSPALLRDPPGEGVTICRKSGRLRLELRRSREQLRFLLAQGERRRECRRAVEQQYQFLSAFLRELGGCLTRRREDGKARYQVELQLRTRGREPDNGDLCRDFPGTGPVHYLLLCDGMGTGLGAAQEARNATGMLTRMLEAGFPPEFALGSLNSLCCLRGRAGAVTVDLLELRLDTGKAAVYKWGAAPSWLLTEDEPKKIGTAGPPPGLGVTRCRETVERLSLGRGEVLLMLSDGVDGEGVLQRPDLTPEVPLGELAARLLEAGRRSDGDDAAVAAVRLHPST